MTYVMLILWLSVGHRQILFTGVPNADVTVRNCKTDAPVVLYTDDAMTVPESNPIRADSVGLVQFAVGKNECVRVMWKERDR